ncbi:MAG: hypothetical protein C4558_08055 [Dehalococcoidia bacterium]|nr:MAG: hypothetical protein C4558_08055 [Dehalococcoidia bacterium]
MAMQVRFNCPTDGCVALIEMEPLEACAQDPQTGPGPGDGIECPRCHVRHPLHLSQAILREHRVDACPLCRCREFFVRKDFPQRIGLVVVAAAAIVSVATFKSNIWLSWGVLAAAVVVDLALYVLVGTVTVCYACRAEYRHVAANPEHEGFDLARSEKY